MISIVIPLYNKAKTIEDTLRSILKQTYNDFEIIIVDDGSTDNSLKIVSGIIDPRIKVYTQNNQGVSAARNFGVKMASQHFIAFLDADDEWDADYLETQIKLIQTFPEASVFGTNYRFKDSIGNISNTILRHIYLDKKSGIITNYFDVASCSHVPIWSSAVVIRKAALDSIGGFPIGVKSGEDLLTWARLAVKYKIAYYIEPKATYNLEEGYNMSSQPVRRQDNGDPVGKSLLSLYKANQNIPFFRQYISHWHKMRASVAVRFGECVETLSESFKALYYNPKNYKVLPFLILSLCPAPLRRKLISLKTSI